MYVILVKRTALERELKKAGWSFKRHGGNHDVWSNGQDETTVPRHNEINEYTAKGILKQARGAQPKGGKK